MLELGAGVGLPGLVCARFAERMVITDFVQSLVENLEYNLGLNTAIDDEESKDEEVQRRNKVRRRVKETARIGYLDWGEVEKKEKVRLRGERVGRDVEVCGWCRRVLILLENLIRWILSSDRS